MMRTLTPRQAFLLDLCSGSEAGSFLRLIDFCITQLKAQGSFRTCNESKEDEKREPAHPFMRPFTPSTHIV